MLPNPSQASAMYSFCSRYSVTYLLIRPPLIIKLCDPGPAVVASKYLISTISAAVIPSAWRISQWRSLH